MLRTAAYIEQTKSIELDCLSSRKKISADVIELKLAEKNEQSLQKNKREEIDEHRGYNGENKRYKQMSGFYQQIHKKNEGKKHCHDEKMTKQNWREHLVIFRKINRTEVKRMQPQRQREDGLVENREEVACSDLSPTVNTE